MKKILFVVCFLGLITFLENCKKDTVYATATSTKTLIADINDSTWIADTINASINYSNNIKTFAFSGFYNNKEVTVSVAKTLTNTPGFALGTYTTQDSTHVFMSYLKYQKDTTGNYSYVSTGVVTPGSGTITITAIDSVKKQITGIFNLTTVKNNYDSSHNIISISVQEVTAGGFNSMPYTFTSN